MDPIQNAKFADSKSKRVVFGYVNKMESKFKLSQIATLIISIILGFYSGEYIRSFLDECFEISQDKLTITRNKYAAFVHSIYLNQWIDSTSKSMVKWTFKINKVNHRSAEIYFGLTSEELAPGVDFSNGKFESFCVDNFGQRYKGNNSHGRVRSFNINTNDLVTFTLDLISGKWLCCIIQDGRNRGVDNELFRIKVSEDVKYKFVLQMTAKGNSVTLKSFEITY